MVVYSSTNFRVGGGACPGKAGFANSKIAGQVYCSDFQLWCGSVSTYLPWTNKYWAGCTTKTVLMGRVSGVLHSAWVRSPGVSLFHFLRSCEGEVNGSCNTQLWDPAGWPCYSHENREAL